MKSAFPDSTLNAQEQLLAHSLVIKVDRHGIIHDVHGGLDRFAAAVGQELRLPENSSSCYDFFAKACEPLFEGAARWSLKSLCSTHPKLRDIKDAFYKTASPEERKALDELFQK